MRRRTDFSVGTVDRLAGFGDGIIDLSLAFFHAQADFQLLLQRKVLEVESLAGADPNARELLSDLPFFRTRYYRG